MAEVNCPDALVLHSTSTVMQGYTTLKGSTAIRAPCLQIKAYVWVRWWVPSLCIAGDGLLHILVDVLLIPACVRIKYSILLQTLNLPIRLQWIPAIAQVFIDPLLKGINSLIHAMEMCACMCVCSCTSYILNTKICILLPEWGHFWAAKHFIWSLTISKDSLKDLDMVSKLTLKLVLGED